MYNIRGRFVQSALEYRVLLFVAKALAVGRRVCGIEVKLMRADENFTTMKPANTNFRHYAETIFNSVRD